MNQEETTTPHPHTGQDQHDTTEHESPQRPSAADDMKFIVKATLTIGGRIIRQLDRLIGRINS
ncbi:hypothetical protein INT08_03855 [Prosthecochloris sp. N3]|uniref:Uncharacterized protein n=1 Tax=Prosthecochloris ethylica TaxID=2743976 RepID=A0ABR9XQL6_9CHLB|nr:MULTISPECIES: hypothetical protein [Prosthecochloris]MEC9486785.1 hypothetical protein [Prosthecochloris sp.]MBF0585529.1 hypothetical protein [Prosthecochloris ethylica]MBF0636315.1 hypothetical protein [Prosthecochloris ethylica]NUK46759.1 hypothetical protein [Prosthecochloris ethylica]RNA64660.1 hypothetical protein CR163_005035 [Prosthecochloris sp. ZM_2]